MFCVKINELNLSSASDLAIKSSRLGTTVLCFLSACLLMWQRLYFVLKWMGKIRDSGSLGLETVLLKTCL